MKQKIAQKTTPCVLLIATSTRRKADEYKTIFREICPDAVVFPLRFFDGFFSAPEKSQTREGNLAEKEDAVSKTIDRLRIGSKGHNDLLKKLKSWGIVLDHNAKILVLLEDTTVAFPEPLGKELLSKLKTCVSESALQTADVEINGVKNIDFTGIGPIIAAVGEKFWPLVLSCAENVLPLGAPIPKADLLSVSVANLMEPQGASEPFTKIQAFRKMRVIRGHLKNPPIIPESEGYLALPNWNPETPVSENFEEYLLFKSPRKIAATLLCSKFGIPVSGKNTIKASPIANQFNTAAKTLLGSKRIVITQVLPERKKPYKIGLDPNRFSSKKIVLPAKASTTFESLNKQKSIFDAMSLDVGASDAFVFPPFDKSNEQLRTY